MVESAIKVGVLESKLGRHQLSKLHPFIGRMLLCRNRDGIKALRFSLLDKEVTERSQSSPILRSNIKEGGGTRPNR